MKHRQDKDKEGKEEEEEEEEDTFECWSPDERPEIY